MANGTWSLTGNALGTPPSGFLGTTDNNALVVETNGQERLRVDASGNVGVGTTRPTAKLYVNNQDNSIGAVLATNTEGPGELRVYSYSTHPVNVSSFGIVHAFYNDERNGFINFCRGEATNGGFLTLGTSGSERLRIDTNGNVGIGTTSPTAKLYVNNQDNSIGAVLATNTEGPGELRVHSYTTHPVNVSSFGIVHAFYNDERNGFINFCRGEATNGGFLTLGTSGSERLRIDTNGNVGIGTSSPATRLHVAGDITVTGDVLLTGADCAEQFDVSEAVVPESGTVLVIDESGALRESCQAYDKKVAGVVSGAGDYRHGILLDRRSESSDRRVPVALVGKVFCKVDARFSPIDVGDLLTTSTTPGHAMKAMNPAEAFGSVIGKALRPLQTGKGLIPILIALQ
jgi:hypothetical protein